MRLVTKAFVLDQDVMEAEAAERACHPVTVAPAGSDTPTAAAGQSYDNV